MLDFFGGRGGAVLTSGETVVKKLQFFATLESPCSPGNQKRLIFETEKPINPNSNPHERTLVSPYLLGDSNVCTITQTQFPQNSVCSNFLCGKKEKRRIEEVGEIFNSFFLGKSVWRRSLLIFLTQVSHEFHLFLNKKLHSRAKPLIRKFTHFF